MTIEGFNDPPDPCNKLLLIDNSDEVIACFRDENHTGPHIGVLDNLVVIEPGDSPKEVK